MKKILTILLSLALLILPMSACGEEDGIKTVEVNEVTHSVFYAPLYVAIEKGYFAEEGLKINLTNGGGADKSMTAVLSKTADIGLMGPESAIYVHNQKKADAPVVFGQLTQKDGAFLVSRTENASFSVNDLKNKEILAGRKGGVPAMSFEYMLKNSGLTENDYTLNFDVQFNMMTSAFISGIADYCTVFEPTASEYEKQGKWHVVASVGELTGEIPYTSFIALESFINNNSETLKSFMKALKKAYDFMSKSTDLEIAQSILKQFPSTSVESIETSVKNYRKIDAWKTDMQATESSFDNLQNVMESAGELTSRVAFNKIVNNTIAKEIFG